MKARQRNEERVRRLNQGDIEVLDGSEKLRDLPAPGQDLLLHGARNANHGIVFQRAQEASHREQERAYSRWRLFCQKVGIDNHFLDDLPQCERELVCRSFDQTLRWNNIDPTKGTISGRTNHMAASTI
jgi:hypothetical protein